MVYTLIPQDADRKRSAQKGHTGIAFEGLQKIRFTRRVNLIFSSEHGAPRKVADFSGQKPWMACEND